MKNKYSIIPQNCFVISKSGQIRFVTKHKNSDTFIDDGLISKQPPSNYCHYENYKQIKYRLKK